MCTGVPVQLQNVSVCETFKISYCIKHTGCRLWHEGAPLQPPWCGPQQVPEGWRAQAGVQAGPCQRAYRRPDPVRQSYRPRQDLLGPADQEEPRRLQPGGGVRDLQERHQGFRLLHQADHDVGVLAVPGELPLAQL